MDGAISKNILEGQPIYQNYIKKNAPGLIELVNSNLMYCHPDQQLNVLYRFAKPDFERMSKIFCEICTDLMKVLNTLGFQYNIHQFGSALTGLAFLGKSYF